LKIVDLTIKCLLLDEKSKSTVFRTTEDEPTLFMRALPKYASLLKEKKKGVIFVGEGFAYGVLGAPTGKVQSDLEGFVKSLDEAAEKKAADAKAKLQKLEQKKKEKSADGGDKKKDKADKKDNKTEAGEKKQTAVKLDKDGKPLGKDGKPIKLGKDGKPLKETHKKEDKAKDKDHKKEESKDEKKDEKKDDKKDKKTRVLVKTELPDTNRPAGAGAGASTGASSDTTDSSTGTGTAKPDKSDKDKGKGKGKAMVTDVVEFQLINLHGDPKTNAAHFAKLFGFADSEL